MEPKKVGMAEAKTAAGSRKLVSEGVGSCVAVCLKDRETNVGGVAHVVLPSKRSSNGSKKYADNLLEELIKQLKAEGAKTENMEAKIFGGGKLFEFSNEIGSQNVESVRQYLEDRGIPVVAEDTGGDKGRSIEFDPEIAEQHKTLGDVS
jgi:chemotaxis protein CheD